MCITKTDFKWIFGINSSEMEMANNINPDCYALYSKMKNLTMSRKNKICEFINKNSNFSKLTESQKVQINLFMRLIEVAIVLRRLKKEPFCGASPPSSRLTTASSSTKKSASASRPPTPIDGL